MASAVKKGKGRQPPAPSPNAPTPETLSLLEYGATLYDTFNGTAASEGGGGAAGDAHRLQLQRFPDYMRHFGFSPERELTARPAPVAAAAEAAQPDEALPWGQPVPRAGWGISAEEREAADRRWAEVQSETAALAARLPDAAALARELTAAFDAVTWRQTAAQCSLRRTRLVYRWLCGHLQRIRLREPPAEPAAAEVGAAHGKGKGGAAGKGAGAAGRGKAAAGGKGKAAPVPVQEATPPPPPPDPLETALAARECTPIVAARLLQRMLEACRVECAVVEGRRKGFSAEEHVPWAWNCVTLDDKQYLVDVAAAVFTGSLRESAADGTNPTLADGDAAAAGASPAAAAAAPPPPPTTAVAASASAAAVDGEEGGGPVLPCLDLGEGPRWAPAARGRSTAVDFYFFTNPAELIYTHLPDAEEAALLTQVPTEVVWELAPNLGPEFFSRPVRLHSHTRSCLIAARSTPVHIAIVNSRPDTTELCGVVYPCALRQLPEELPPIPCAPGDDAGCPAALGPQWVWQQRSEATDVSTFTIVVPDCGFFSFVVGARTFHEDPYNCRLPSATDGFTPIARYQLKVNYTPMSSSPLPRQYLSPSVVRLIHPLCGQLQAGRQTFAVMPTCGNVLAVAVVGRANVSAAPPAVAAPATTTHKGNAAPPPPPPPPQTRRLLALLPFDAARAVFEGAVDLVAGETVEVWVRHAAPDRNGLTHNERVAAAERRQALAAAAAAAAAPPPPAPTRPGSKKNSKAVGRKAVESAQQTPAMEAAVVALAQRLDAARVFVPAFGRMEVRKLPPRDLADLIQPPLTVEQEREATLRRLTGATPDLYHEAAQLKALKVPPVGAFFDGRRGQAAATRS